MRGKRRKKERVGMNQEGRVRLYTRLEKRIGYRAETEMIRF